METAEEYGYYSLLIPTRFANGLFGEDAPLAETWTTATALAAVTSRIRFLIAVRPGFIALGLFAQMAAALHQISKGRVDINIVPGGIQNDFERVGEESTHETRYERAEEFIAACRKLWMPSPGRWTSTATTTGCVTPTVRRTPALRQAQQGGHASTWAGRRRGHWDCRGARPTCICPGLSHWRTPPAAT